ncbi:MAG: SagB/ThcOx family dehydrogenase [Rhodospirillales bacterium]|nr:MAG: SagB/ThcOx family dehydrogenase [Rhodospirillales bacterium]
MPLEQALAQRHSVRAFGPEPLSLAGLSQVLWAAQGITRPDGKRTAPSAGALYPLEIFVVAGKVTDLEPGVYRYRPQGHGLLSCMAEDKRSALCGAALEQNWMAEAPAILVIGAVFERTTVKYGRRGQQYVLIDCGLAAGNICLQAAALGWGATVVGAFKDGVVKELLGMSADETPLALLPVGREAAAP